MNDAEVRLEEIQRYKALFVAAFDELHRAVIERVRKPDTYLTPHYDYPVMSQLQSGFPSFREAGGFDEKSPRNYVGALLPNTIALALMGSKRPKEGLTHGSEFADFLKKHAIGDRLRHGAYTAEDDLITWRAERLVAEAVERYFHLYGLDAEISANRRDLLISGLIGGTINRSFDLTLIVPIAMTQFNVRNFRLTPTSYIMRLPKRLQLARARMNTIGSGAEASVMGAATHAFVQNGWALGVDSVGGVERSLGSASEGVRDAADSFFGALRIATGVRTGYSQIVWLPRKWALTYFCDLPPVYGTALRQYPDEFDDYGWVREGARVNTSALQDVRRIYRAVVDNNSEAVRLALKRLNGCLTRSDPADAILDGTIGLELLLGDDQNQSLSYKLRLRAGALAARYGGKERSARDVAALVKNVYDRRSAIVHGKRKKGSRKASEPADTRYENERLVASELLRFVLNTLLTHPEYQSPSKIDEDLLLGGEAAGSVSG
ncbi:hypothetical protein RHEC894_CH02697 [Rhizobium sp. CIAT894]|uniref:HEPN domain-containing protein n=1 Tax=Rhizobium sp. CIAT894 TaxID=2020312 RepID=UPI000A1FAAC4|nr:HEPN domain-containing protein [Rhizobium sp. CIAT894]ARM88984.1 hypothetical protein RHEC894_CH02697 [Rhizobium sp. CIAT894]